MGLGSASRGAIATSAALAVVAGLLLFGLGWLAWLGGAGGAGGHPAPAVRAVKLVPHRVAGRGVTTVATVLRTAPRYAQPGRRGRGEVPSSWWGHSS
ncbi:MAG: hypothetical protein J2P25_17690, partial [Nocardiopsaceae bacterium]|nr:hypothetical protein [Nocardiopsaceae bacterium]